MCACKGRGAGGNGRWREVGLERVGMYVRYAGWSVCVCAREMGIAGVSVVEMGAGVSVREVVAAGPL